MNNEQLWQAVLGELELTLSKANFTTWFKNTNIIERSENNVTVVVPNAFTKAWLENKYNKYIVDALKNISKNKYNKVFYKVGNSQAEIKKPEKINISNLKNTLKEDAEKEIIKNENQDNTYNLNPKYTFNKFVVGKSNELAYAASKAVAKKPGTAYNPLFIYGGVGLGKTHLLQAIGNEILKNNPKKKLLYVTSEKFTNEFIQSIRSKKTKDFQNKYRNIDVLIVDDIQFISGKEQTQEQMFHTFNELHQNNKQIILSSDRTPKSIPDLEQRLESRFEWGMIVDISEPDLETKIAIIESKLQENSFKLKKEIIEFLAENINGNIRKLEGILNRIIANCQLLNKKNITIDDVKNIIKTVNIQIPKGSLTPKKIINVVCEFFDVKLDDVLGSSRKKELVVPRQITMYLMREEAKSSFPNIGQELGGRDHTTAMHAYTKISKEVEKGEKIKSDIDLIKKKLYSTD